MIRRSIARMRRRPLKGLRAELAGLRKNVKETDRHMSDLAEEFWRNDGVCCPTCGVPGYGDLALKQERREKRIREVEAKLARDTRQPEKTP